MRSRPIAAVVLLLAFFAVPASQAAESPYKGQEKRPIKALSEKEVKDLLAGNGMGLAKAAELNSYPGPRHVLDAAPDLALTETQRAAAQRVFAAMNREAVALGRRIVERERELNARFASRAIDKASLAAATAELGRLAGSLRRVHLQAHLEMREILTPHQIALYDRFRGYASSGGHGGMGGHPGH